MMQKSGRSFASLIAVAATLVLGISLLGVPSAQAGTKVRLPEGGAPADECVPKGDSEAKKAARAACDLLAFSGGFQHGYTRSCDASDEADLGATCDDLATAAGCLADENLWYCFGDKDL
jgi:hypothetical protein